MIDSVSAEAASAPDLKRARRRKPAAEPASVDRLPPHSPEAERGVLGCILLSPNDCMGLAIEKLKGGADVFYDLRHRTIFTTLVEMYDKREAIDIITLQQRLKDKQLLEQVGGLAAIASLPDAVPSAANISYYLDIVHEKFLLRKMIATCTDVVARVYDYEGEVDALMDEVERDILRISESRVQSQTVTMKELVKRAINTIEDFHQRQGMLTGLATGFPDLDKMTSGLHPGEMIVIAARPSMGKTSLAMNIAEHVAVDLKLPVGVFSLEMTSESLVLRMLCSRSRVNLRSVREGFLAERDFPKLTGAAGKLASAPLFIDDSSGLSILQLRAKARRMAQQHKIKLFVIDYLQLLHSTARRAENRQQEIADISNGIKALAKELNVPVIVLSQLNRELEKDRNRKPRMSDLRESGAIEQDADLIGLLYKPLGGEDDEGGSEEGDAVPVNLLIAKQRNGPTGDVPLTFLKSFTRFESAARVSDDGVPN
ncbi:MAG TPA: replicative DNA helicase [Verrucomicrobia bacterium]|nr:replicative DNA helicase [Verrucomicrobiota bacterium]HOB32007.1 replicative DNA helicase [Verrucomicrobiota bacterium]HOP98272.1 replicative DNA helicase [Verrucomicrobiota bacterium]HPU55304.1 replicative DNA helicase [Verrucomicrobiota bacterium]